uniref:B box-type domain-containing protein n=1 Tax=Romanomermis culicivorax TaxID=13658 RepID=A0A915I9U8_ROMCU
MKRPCPFRNAKSGLKKAVNMYESDENYRNVVHQNTLNKLIEGSRLCAATTTTAEGVAASPKCRNCFSSCDKNMQKVCRHCDRLICDSCTISCENCADVTKSTIFKTIFLDKKYDSKNAVHLCADCSNS